MAKVILGMSGGVDSSVSAALLKQQGYEVEGISFILWQAEDKLSGCCSLSSAQSAARTAGRLGIRHDSLDVRDEFSRQVVEPFAAAYARGLTPNPCILCNRHIKFPFLLREAEKRGADFIATGHYAIVERTADAGEPVVLKKGLDGGKDQSYVLYQLQEEELRRLVLPLGALRKQEVREIARSLKLEAAYWPESQEICFVEDNDYGSFLEKQNPSMISPGPVVDRSGKELARHQGIHRFTVGQRKGLGIPSLTPLYVTRIDAEKRAVQVGSREDAAYRSIMVDQLHWLRKPLLPAFAAGVKIRSMMKEVPAVLELKGDAVVVSFDEPVWAPSPGQSAVFYEGERVLGGGVIQRTLDFGLRTAVNRPV
ncbi:MAG: tRNA 2-thiouridine(34) synthase MnmA [Thermodesulfovibrio sp.]|nr:tRNA 2-thiouridine(34) synthase MnmA [Thermodesulfovibrio sp.]